MENIIETKNIVKKYKSFTLDIPKFNIPQGFSAALIGENGAGKTTLLDILSGVNLDFTGSVSYFGKFNSADEGDVRENIGYTAPNSYFLPHWTVKDVKEICSITFKSFIPDKFDHLLNEMSISEKSKVSELSDGNRMRLMLASVFARETKILMLDEPASPLDPVMRDKLCDMIRTYISDGNGEKSVIFSTHNINDTENATDYAAIVKGGKVVEQGFVEDLKEKYTSVKGEAKDTEKAKKFMFDMSDSKYGFEGIILSENLDKLAGLDISTESPSLHQISVAVMKRG